MRIVHVKSATDIETLWSALGSEPLSAALRADIKRLNPQLDLASLSPGSVLLVPGRVAVKAADAPTTATPHLREFRTQALGALRELQRQVRSHHEQHAGRRKELTTIFKSAAFKRAVAADPSLEAQVAASTRTFADDQADAKTADEAMDALRRGIEKDIAAMLGERVG